MGSRQSRLEYEAIRQQQSVVRAMQRRRAREAMALDLNNLLGDYQAYLHTMKREQRESFRDYQQKRQVIEADRKQTALEAIRARKTEINEHTKATRTMLREFHTVHVEMSNALHKELATYSENIRQNTTNLLNSFNKERQEKARELGEYLANFTSDLKAQELERRRQAKDDTATRREYLLDLLDLDCSLPK